MLAIRQFVLSILVSVLTGCAFGQKINYTGASNFQIPENVSKTVALAVLDKRPDVVAGDHSLQWVGYSRPPLGIPYGVHTESGRPLSDDLASFLQSSLSTHNVVAQIVSTQPFEDRQVVVARLVSYRNLKNIIVTLNDWKTDSYVGLSVSLYHSVVLEVTDSKGRYLGRSSSVGVKSLSSGYPLSAAVTDIFQELFNAPEVRGALVGR
jgi:hypothetical protein